MKSSIPLSFGQSVSHVLENGVVLMNFPKLKVVPRECGIDETGYVSLLKGYGELTFDCIGKKILYHICVKTLHVGQLKEKVDTKWRSQLSIPENILPSWRLLYKPPISKRCGDLQWRLIHCILATNKFIAKMNENVTSICPFCDAIDTIFHMFCDCSRLDPIFVLLERIISKLGLLYTNSLFILGCGYRKSAQEQCVLTNFVVGQAKLAIFKSHQEKNAGRDVCMVALFKSLVESRVIIEYTYYKHINNVLFF